MNFEAAKALKDKLTAEGYIAVVIAKNAWEGFVVEVTGVRPAA